MAVRVHIPQPLMHFTNGRAVVLLQCPGSTLAGLLEDFFSMHPGIRDRIMTEQGMIREHVNIFVGHTNTRSSNGLKTIVADEAEVWIIPAISGGQGSQKQLSQPLCYGGRSKS